MLQPSIWSQWQPTKYIFINESRLHWTDLIGRLPFRRWIDWYHCLQSPKSRAAGIEHLTAEQLQIFHHAITAILAKLLDVIIVNGIVADSFCTSYTVLIPKCDNVFEKPLSINDFRDISICSIIFKYFEYCIIDRFSTFLVSSDNQFGFKIWSNY